MDLTQAAQAHADWKVKLRMAIQKREQLDAGAIAKDNACALGQWLHGPAKGSYGKLRSYADCVAKHAAFHREAAAVARLINAQDFGKAEAQLGSGTPYAAATSAVGSAILGLKKEASA